MGNPESTTDLYAVFGENLPRNRLAYPVWEIMAQESLHCPVADLKTCSWGGGGREHKKHIV